MSIVVDVVDSISEAMRELESIQDKRDTVLCSTMLLVYAHKKCKSVGVSVIFIFILCIYLFNCGFLLIQLLLYGLSFIPRPRCCAHIREED